MLQNQMKGTSANCLVVEYVTAIYVTRCRFPTATYFVTTSASLVTAESRIRSALLKLSIVRTQQIIRRLKWPQ